MKIIEPSAHIIEDDLPKNVYQRIDACAAVCYQRPAKPTEEEAEQFCRSMVERGHLTTLEMVVVHLMLPVSEASAEFLTSKFIAHAYSSGRCLLTGSLRSFKEFLEANKSSSLLSIRSFLAKEFPVLFTSDNFREYPKVRFAKPEELPWQHKHVAARFIVNRAVTHELVRHRPCTFLQESQRYCRYGDDVTFVQPRWVELRDESEISYWALGSSDSWLKHMFACEGYYQERLREGLTPQQARGGLPNDAKTEVICYASLPQWLHIFNLRCSPAADPEMRRVMIPLREEFKEKYPEAFR